MKKVKYMKYFFIICMISFPHMGWALQGEWVLKNHTPTTRGGTSAAVIDGKIYVLGGNDGPPNFRDLDINEVYDPLTNTWDTTKKDLPTARTFLAAAVVNDTIYAIGGGFPTTPKSKLEAYDPANDTWAEKADMLIAESEIQAVSLNGIIYVIGGAFGRHDCQAYDPAADRWSQKTEIPDSAGGFISLTSYDSLIYAFGGSLSHTGPIYRNVYSYNPQTDRWTKKKAMPTPRFALHTFLVNGKIYAVGGSQGTGTSVATVEIYDPISDTWETAPDMPKKLSYFAGAVVNSKIYIIGGTPDWAAGSTEVWEYDPAVTSNIEIGEDNIEGFALYQNYPNPFNPETTFEFHIGDPPARLAAKPVAGEAGFGFVSLKIFNILGNEIATLVNEEKLPGKYKVSFNAAGLPSGVYLYRLSCGKFQETKKFVLLK